MFFLLWILHVAPCWWFSIQIAYTVPFNTLLSVYSTVANNSVRNCGEMKLRRDILTCRPWNIESCLDSHTFWGIVQIEQISLLHKTQPDQGAFLSLVRLDHCPQVHSIMLVPKEGKERDWWAGWLGFKPWLHARVSHLYFPLSLHTTKHALPNVFDQPHPFSTFPLSST